MQGLPKQSIQLVVLLRLQQKNSTGNGTGGKWPKTALQAGYASQDDCMPHKEYVAWQRGCLSEMVQLLRSDDTIFYNHKWRVQRRLLQDRADGA